MRNLIRQLFDALERGRRFVAHDIWYVGRPGEPMPEGFIIKQVRVLILLVRNLIEDALILRAAALTFVTILAVVPFLALTFYVIQQFDLGKSLPDLVAKATGQPPAQMSEEELRERFINLFFPDIEQLEGGEDLATPEDTPPPETDASGESSDGKINPLVLVLEQAERGSNPKAIGLVGLFFVVAAVFGLMWNIESSFNSIWGIQKRRSLYRMFSDYLIICILLPFLVVGVLTVTAVFESNLIDSTLHRFAFIVSGLKYLVLWSVFSILYIAVPNTQVKWRHGILGGVVAGSLWALSAWAYVTFQIGVSRNELLYSGFALFPLLMTWIYLSWIILLFGAEVTFAYQNEKTFAMERLAGNASFAYREAVAIRAMVDVARRFDTGQPGLNVNESAQAWNVPVRLLTETLEQLEQADLVRRYGGEPPCYQPGRSLDKISVGDVIHALREHGNDPSLLREDDQLQPLLHELARQRNGALHIPLSDTLRRFYPPQPAMEIEERAALLAEPDGDAEPADPTRD